MIRKVQSIIINWLIMTGAISSCDKELYQYALNSLVLLISPLLMSVIIATIMGIPVNGVLIVIPFMTIILIVLDSMGTF